MTEYDGLALGEYQALRDEVSRLESQIFEMLRFAVTGAVAIIAFGLQQAGVDNDGAWAILAIVPLVLIPAGLFTLARALMEMRIAAYIQARFEEGSPQANWEQVLSKRSATSRAPDVWLAASLFAGYAITYLAALSMAWGVAPLDQAVPRGVLWSETVLTIALAAGIVFAVVTRRREHLEEGDLPAFRELCGRSMTERDGRYTCAEDTDGGCEDNRDVEPRHRADGAR